MIIGISKTNESMQRVKNFYLHIWNVPEIKLFNEDGSISS